MTPILCTLFDSQYLAKGLALLRSLYQHEPRFGIFVLALDDAAALAVNDLRIEYKERAHYLQAADEQKVYLCRLYEFLTDDLAACLAQRNAAERAWTLAPQLVHYLLNVSNEGAQLPHLTYVDADSFLFGPLAPVYHELKQAHAEIGIVPHRFPPHLLWRQESNGVYNVNFVFFRNTERARACAYDWAQKTFHWCYQRVEHDTEGRLLFGDQGYLDTWPFEYGAYSIEHLGVNLAPWNQLQYQYTFEENLYIKHAGRFDRVLLYHFHEFDSTRMKRGGYELHPMVIEHLYKEYEHHIQHFRNAVAAT